jgi:hypothetical protein
MLVEYNNSKPKKLKAGEYHIPFGNEFNAELLFDTYKTLYGPQNAKTPDKLFNERIAKIKIAIAVARAARVSYTVVGEEGKKPDYLADVKLHDRLAGMGHWSPFEHIAKAMSEDEMIQHRRDFPRVNEEGEAVAYFTDNELGWSGNFRGFIQYRKMFKGENRKDNRVVAQNA